MTTELFVSATLSNGSFAESVLSLDTSACPAKLGSNSERVSSKITGVSQVQHFDTYNKHVLGKAGVILAPAVSFESLPSVRPFRAAAARTESAKFLGVSVAVTGFSNWTLDPSV